LCTSAWLAVPIISRHHLAYFVLTIFVSIQAKWPPSSRYSCIKMTYYLAGAFVLCWRRCWCLSPKTFFTLKRLPCLSTQTTSFFLYSISSLSLAQPELSRLKSLSFSLRLYIKEYTLQKFSSATHAYLAAAFFCSPRDE